MNHIAIVLAFIICLMPLTVGAAPQVLESVSLESPDGTYAANVEWDDVGFIGRIKMLIFTTGEKPVYTAELPQMNPAPANLNWIDDKWVACESFFAEQGAAFCYMDASRGKAYLVEILAPQEDADWIISYTTNDAVSSDSIHSISQGQSSKFPILLRDLPEDGNAYLSPDFVVLMADAVDAYTQWRSRQKFTELKFLSEITEDPTLGCLVVADVDNNAELVYFPQGTTTTREMLALTQRKKLPDEIQQIVDGINPPTLKIAWEGIAGEFSINAVYEDKNTSQAELIRGSFAGVKDFAYAGPGVKDLVKQDSNSISDKAADSPKPKGEKPEAKKSPGAKPVKSSSKKSPSRSN